MKNRIFAWIILVGFILLLINLIFIHKYWTQSLALYLLVVFIFLFSIKRNKNEKEYGDEDMKDGMAEKKHEND